MDEKREHASPPAACRIPQRGSLQHQRGGHSTSLPKYPFTMPYISTEALIGGALVLVLAVGYQFLPTSSASKSAKKRGKKKAKGSGAGSGHASDELKLLVEAQATSGGPEGKKAGKRKKAKEEGKLAPPVVQGQAQSTTSVSASSGPSASSDSGEDTPAEPPSFASVAGGSGQAKGKPKTLAERIAPKARKTKVDE